MGKLAKFAAHALFGGTALLLSGCLDSGQLSGNNGLVALDIQSVSPSGGATAGGTLLTLTGVGVQAGAVVRTGDVACSVISTSSTTIYCLTQAHAVGAVDVVVGNPDGKTVTLTSAYTFRSNLLLTSIAPAIGNVAGAMIVTVTGNGFLPGATVSLGANTCTSVNVLSPTQLTCLTPASVSVGAVAVTVNNPDSQSATLNNAYTYQNAPLITAISPSSGTTLGNTNIVITGGGFKTGATVYFGATPCPTTLITSTQVFCTTGAHAVGAVDVVVANTDGQSVTSTNGYTYAVSPNVTGVTPVGGSTAGGTPVSILGSGFQSGASVLIGGLNCLPVTVVSSNQINCTTAAHAAGAVSASVINPDSQISTLNSAFTYQQPPTVASVNPPAGPIAGGTALSIGGSGFKSGATVTVGGAACTSLSVVSSALITCTTTGHVAGLVDVIVTNTDTQTGTAVGAFTYRAAPTVTAIVPSGGNPVGGNTITINGTGFVAGATVDIGGNACSSVNVVSATSITCVAPAHASAAVNIQVTNTDAQLGQLLGGYTYRNAPTVLSVAPSSGGTAGGTTITVNGTGFVSGAAVKVGTLACGSVTVVSATQITCSTPPAAAGLVGVTVTNTDTQNGALAASFTYIPSPILSAIVPIGGPLGGGTTVTITGANFLSGITVSLGGVSCGTVTVQSATQLTCVTGANSGAVSLQVTNPDGQSVTMLNAFTYRPPPDVTATSLALGQSTGGNAVTLTGTGFVAGATVKFGSTAATSVTVVSATQITCVSPAGTAGSTVGISVTNVDTQTDTLSSAFTYSPQSTPVISSILPIGGDTAGGTLLTISGSGFVAGSTVQLGSGSCTSVNVVSANTITCLTPAESMGAVTVTVTSIDTQAATYNSYNYSPPPVVVGIAPGAGGVGGGTPVVVTGTGFLTGAQVYIGGAACGGVIVSSWTQLTCYTTANIPGLFEVTVINNDNQFSTLNNAYTYHLAPTIQTVTPPGGVISGGTAVTIAGTGFLSGATVMLGTAACGSVSVNSATQITCTSAASPSGPVDVTVTNTDNQQALKAHGYLYGNGPLITAITPSSGVPTGGDTIVISGASFLAGATVDFDGVAAASVTVDSDHQLTVVTPAHAGGLSTVTVTNTNSLTASKVNGFFYGTSSLPTLTLIAPVGGTPAGGTTVVLTGSNFASGMTATIGGTVCSALSVDSPTQVTCTTGAHVSGAADVVVTLSDGRSATLTNGYTYEEAPVFFAMFPSHGTLSGGETLSLLGSHFLSGDTVTIGGTTCTATAVISSHKIVCTAPAGTAGKKDVVVTHADSQSDTLTNGYEYAGPNWASITIKAGTASAAGFADGATSVARVYNPSGIALFGGVLYFADESSYTIRQIDLGTGIATTLAGLSGTSGCVDATGTAARFKDPTGIASDGTYIYVSDFTCNAIRRVTISTGDVITIAGALGGAAGFWDGTGVTAQLRNPQGLALGSGVLYFSDYNNHAVRQVDVNTFQVTTLAGNGNCGWLDANGASAYFCNPTGLATDGSFLYVADTSNRVVRTVDLGTFNVTTLAGTHGSTGFVDGAVGTGKFNWPNGLSLDGTSLFVADFQNYAVRVVDTTTGNLTTISGGNGNGYGDGDPLFAFIRYSGPNWLTCSSTKCYIADSANNALRVYNRSSHVVSTLVGVPNALAYVDGTGLSARFWNARGMTTDGTYYYVADSGNHMIRKIDPATWAVTTLTGTNATVGSTDSTLAGATFVTPVDITCDGTNLYVVDQGAHNIRQIDLAAGNVTTLAGGVYGTPASYLDATGSLARFSSPSGITTDGEYLYVTDTGNKVVRRVEIATGNVVTIAGQAGSAGSNDGTAFVARFSSLARLTTDGTSIFVLDANAVRRIQISTGAVSTLAGSAGSANYFDATGTSARFSSPQAIVTDGVSLFVADYNNRAIRKVRVTDGATSTLIGHNPLGPNGDTDGSLGSAYLTDPRGLLLNANTLLFSNSFNVRLIQ